MRDYIEDKEMSNKSLFHIIFYLNLISFVGLWQLSGSAHADRTAEKYLDKVKIIDVVRAKFCSGSDQIRVTTPSEANPEGPMSFVLGEGEEIYILDQLNR